ncbi:MAG: wax ester/triacylglycerol synthase family O-acyltransferase [Myxococcota bacterium]
MEDYTFERLSAQDAGFLWAETANQPMHVGAVALFESDTLQGEEGGIDIDRYRAQVESILHWIPRYRQKIEWTPVERWPVWVDDRSFDLGHHIRHIALPAPGTQAQLKEIVGRINARRLDRRHALWECWLIEGVERGEQFAILNKIHHCMIDGAAGADLSQILMSPSPRYEERPPVPYLPRPSPRRSDLVADTIGRTFSRPLELSQKLVRNWTSSNAEREARGEANEPSVADRLRAFGKLTENALAPASATPMNGDLGPRRRFEWLTMPLDDVRELRRELGCTINDIVLATVTGAVRRYLFRRRLDVRKLDFRVSAPVSMRRPEHEKIQGNHVSSWIVPLPLESEDPLERVSIIGRQTEAFKSEGAALAVDSIMQLAEWVPGPVLERALPAISSSGPVNMIVTNVPGPQFPLYLAGTKLLAMYPIVPLVPGGGLGVALFSYEGKLCWGFNADDELVPDLDLFVSDISASFEELRAAVVERFMERRTASPTRTPEPEDQKAMNEPESKTEPETPETIEEPIDFVAHQLDEPPMLRHSKAR